MSAKPLSAAAREGLIEAYERVLAARDSGASLPPVRRPVRVRAESFDLTRAQAWGTVEYLKDVGSSLRSRISRLERTYGEATPYDYVLLRHVDDLAREAETEAENYGRRSDSEMAAFRYEALGILSPRLLASVYYAIERGLSNSEIRRELGEGYPQSQKTSCATLQRAYKRLGISGRGEAAAMVAAAKAAGQWDEYLTEARKEGWVS